ncbi:MAG TPA: cation diffusion facilitator family transporter [Tepidisphaeraceae bacterium]|jgi:cation diffusion facilitator family transporter
MRIPKIERRAMLISFVTGLTLLALKFSAYSFTGSPAIFADAVESIVNVMASVVAIWALALAHTPPDESHPYGHGKVEFMSAGLEGGMIALASLFILIRTIDQLLFYSPSTEPLDIGLLLLGVATIVNGVVGYGLIRTGKAQHSLTLEADGHHLLSDAITSVAVVAGLILVVLTGWTWLDPLMAVGVAIYIAYAGSRLLRQAAGGLMDRQDIDDEKALVAILNAHMQPDADPKICSYHKLRHRHSGRYHWVDFHLVIPAHLSIADGHHIASVIEKKMELTLGQGNATAHVEPCLRGKCAVCEVLRSSAFTDGGR